MKIVQITDTHLGRSKPHFNGNWAPLAAWIADLAPDLVVHTGDLSLDGADEDEDLAFSMALLRALPVPVLCVPGNHDVGHLPGSVQPVDATRLERWHRHVGPDRFVADHGGWRLVGLNGLLFGGDDAMEEEHFAWLAAALAGRGGRRVAVFSHKPLYVDDPGEGDTGYWGVGPVPRRRLAELFAAHDVALHASGHLHRAWTGRLGATALVWAPSSGFVVGALERDLPGASILGAVVHELGETVASEIVAVPGLARHLIDDVIHEVYPQFHPKARAEADQ